MSAATSRRYVGIALVVLLVIVALFAFRAYRHASAANNEVALVSPDGKLQRLAVNTSYSVDVVAQKASTTVAGSSPTEVSIDPNAATTILGWAIDAPSGKLASKVYAVINGTQWFDCSYGQDRPDVAKILLVPAYSKSGFQCVIPQNKLTSGSDTLAIAIVNASGSGFYSGYSSASLIVQ